MDLKYAVIIQCSIAHRRCSGFACTDSFYKREGSFEGYDDGVKYISFTCGGCCGKGVASKLEHLTKKVRKAEGISKEQVSVHLASCMVRDNYHYDRFPNAEYIRGLVSKKGYINLVEGSYISKNAVGKRKNGVYNSC